MEWLSNFSSFRNFTWSRREKPQGVELSSDNLRAYVLYNSNGTEILRTEEKITQETFSDCVYFEVKILALGQSGSLYIGLTPGSKSIHNSVESGVEGSYWYSNEGSICKNGWTPFGPRFGENDVIGCGIERKPYNSDYGSKYRLFYTFNGKNLGTTADVQENDLEDKGFYPSVYFIGQGWDIEGNFSGVTGSPFQFDLRSHYMNNALNRNMKSDNIKLLNRNVRAEIKKKEKPGGIVMAEGKLKPTESKVDYFEVKIFRQFIDQNDRINGMTVFGGDVKLGLKTRSFGEDLNASNDISSNRYWYRYDGKKLECRKEDFEYRGDAGLEPYGVTYGEGDIIGCGLTHDRKVFFTVNGESQGLAFSATKEDFADGLYPFIDLQSSWGVEANFGKERFAFDPDKNCRNELFTLQ